MRMFTIRSGAPVFVKSRVADKYIDFTAKTNMPFFLEDVYIDPVGKLTRKGCEEDAANGYYGFSVGLLDIKVHLCHVQVM